MVPTATKLGHVDIHFSEIGPRRHGIIYEVFPAIGEGADLLADTRLTITRHVVVDADVRLVIARHILVDADVTAQVAKCVGFRTDTRLMIIKVFRPHKEDDMSLGLITKSGRIMTARLLMGADIDGLTHCAIGDGDEHFVDPRNPPEPDFLQTALRHERARKKATRVTFLREDPEGAIEVGGTRYSETEDETTTIGIYFRFDESEANGITIKEYGFFGGTVTYMDGIQSDYAADGVHSAENSTGQVKTPGYLYEVKNIPDFTKTADTRVELVGVIKV